MLAALVATAIGAALMASANFGGVRGGDGVRERYRETIVRLGNRFEDGSRIEWPEGLKYLGLDEADFSTTETQKAQKR